MTSQGDLDPARLSELLAREGARFREARPRSQAMIARAREHMPNGMPMSWMAYYHDQLVYIDHGQGPGFTDVDGFSYVNFNASDMAMFCGHANPAIVAAVRERAARSANTAPFDVTGHPATTVPAGLADGLPAGLMIVGRHLEDGLCLRVARAYENAVSGFPVPPGH